MEYSGNEFDAIVVGGGAMGSSTAYQLAKRGSKTLLLEQFDFLHHRGSSHGESRTIRVTYPEDYYHPMVIESAQLWDQTQTQIGYRVFFKAQQFDMGPSDSPSLLSVVASCHKNGTPHHVLDARQVASKFAGRIEIPENWIGVSSELGGVIKPTKAVAMFQTLAIQSGAILRDNKEVKSIVKDEVKGGILVVTSDGEKFWGKKCVLTAGAWMSKLVKTVIGLELPIQPLETRVYYWRIKEGHESEFTIGGEFPTFASYGDPYIYGTPSLEFPGLIKVALHAGYPCDPDKRPWGGGGAGGGVVKLGLLKEWIEERFKGVIDAENGPVMTQICMYSMTPDEDFVIDFLGGEFGKDVVIAGGFSGHGFKMVPAMGRILADLVISGEAIGVDLQHFRIARFQENPRGNVKDFQE